MNFNIRKYLSGGGAAPFTYYTPVTVNNSSTPASLATASTESSSTKSSSSKTGELTDKDLFSMLKEIDGLPSDMNLLFDSISNIYSKSAAVPEGISSSNLNSRYIKVLLNVKLAAFNKKEYDNAYKQAIKNDTLSEMAITDRGALVAMDKKGNIKQISVDEYSKNSKSYNILTNSDLLQLRANSKAMDNSILSVVQGGVSMNMINKYILEITSKLGTSKNTINGYSESENGIIKGLQFLLDAPKEVLSTMGVSGLYKSKYATSKLKTQALLALNYIYSTMPLNMKTLLQIKGDGTKEGVMNLLGNIINSGVDSEETFDTNLILDENGNKPGSKSSSKSSSGQKGSTTGMESSPIVNFVLGVGNRESITLNPGSSYAINTLGIVGVATDGSGHPLGSNATLQDLSKGLYGGNLDFSKATMGGALIANGMLNRILLNSSKIMSVELPTTTNEQGIEVPDFSLCKKLELANEGLKQAGIDPDDASKANEINLAYQKIGLKPKFDALGNLNTQSYGRFAAILGRADESVFGKDPTFENGTIFEVDDDTVRDAYELALLGNEGTKKYKLSSGLFGLGGTSLYEGTIFIPMTSDVNMADALSNHSLLFGNNKDANLVYATSNGINSDDYQIASKYKDPGNLSQYEE